MGRLCKVLLRVNIGSAQNLYGIAHGMEHEGCGDGVEQNVPPGEEGQVTIVNAFEIQDLRQTNKETPKCYHYCQGE